MIKKLTFLAVAALLALPGLIAPAAAQDEGAAPLSLQQCIDLALKTQDDVAIGQNSVTAAKERETQAKSSYYPQIALSNTAFVINGGDGRVGQSPGTALTITQNIYDGGLRKVRVNTALADTTQNRYALDRTRQTVVFSVTNNYFTLLRARQLLAVQDAKVKYLEGQLAMVKARVEAGDAAEVDQLPIEASLANTRVDQLAAGNSVRTATIGLQNAMGLTPRADFAVSDYTPPAGLSVAALDDYLTGALVNRPDYKQTKVGITVAQDSVKTARIQLRPRPVVSGQFDQGIGGDNNNAFSITGGLVFDLFDGNNNRAVYREAQSQLSSAQLRVAQAEKDIRADVQQSYLDVTNARERLAASELSLQAAQKNFTAQEGRYQQGLAIPLDLLNAQVEVATAQSNAVQARYDYYTAIARLEYAEGVQGGLYGK